MPLKKISIISEKSNDETPLTLSNPDVDPFLNQPDTLNKIQLINIEDEGENSE